MAETKESNFITTCGRAFGHSEDDHCWKVLPLNVKHLMFLEDIARKRGYQFSSKSKALLIIFNNSLEGSTVPII